MSKLTGYVHVKNRRDHGSLDSLATITVDVREQILPWQARGLSYTRSGYGGRIPTQYMVRFNGKWRRVYCAIYSNSGTLYIGNLGKDHETKIVQIDRD